MMRFIRFIFIGILSLVVTASVCRADDAARNIQLNVKTFTLQNGMLFLIVERPTTPQIACRLAIRAGSALEESGRTGIAHLLEHMMFKGTKNFGTLDAEKDRELQAQIEAAYQTVLREQNKRKPDYELIEKKRKEMDKLRMEVQDIYIPQAFSSQLGRNGAVGVNAFTSKDQTQYMASVPSDMIEQWFSIVSEQLFEPSWREFYVEKEVVQREWAFRYINNPQGAAWLDLSATAYTAHPYRNPTIGWKSDMEKYTTRAAMDFHETYYNPTNSVCVLVGDVKAEDARKLAEIYFARYPAGKRAPERVTQEPSQEGPRRSVRFLKGARTPLVTLGFHTAPMGTQDFYAVDAMTMVLSHGRGSRMTQNIINKGHALEAWAYHPDNRYGGMVILGGSPKEPDDLKEGLRTETSKRDAYVAACESLEEILMAEVAKLKTDLVSKRELQRIKKLNEREFLERMRSNEDLAGTLATLEVQVGWRYLTTYLEEMEAITPEEIRRVAGEYIRADKKTSVYVIPGGKPDQPPEQYAEVRSLTGSAAARVVKTDTSKNHSIYATPEGWKHPLSFERKPKKIDYPRAEFSGVEGVPMFYLPDRELPLIDLTLLVKAGAVDLAEDQIGLPALIDGSLIRGGTETYSPSEMAMVLDEKAIRLSVSVGEEVTRVGLSVTKADWKKGLEHLEEILTRPRFDASVLEAVKQQTLTHLNRQADNAQTVAMREGALWFFRGHPYGRDPLQGLQTIPNITREDLINFLKRYFVRANIVAAVAGDIEKEVAEKSLGALFRALPDSKAPERRMEDPRETPPVVTLIHKPGQVQSQIGFRLPSVKRTDPDYWNISLLMDIFGGGDSLLFKRLRDDLGFVYSAWFYQTYKWQAGTLVGYMGCQGTGTRQAVEETVRIMTSLHGNVPEGKLEQKRLDSLNSFVFNVDSPTELVDVYARYHIRKEPLDTLTRIQDAFISASKEELEALARKFLDPKKLQVFVVADKTMRIKTEGGEEYTLEDDVERLAKILGLPFRGTELR